MTDVPRIESVFSKAEIAEMRDRFAEGAAARAAQVTTEASRTLLARSRTVIDKDRYVLTIVDGDVLDYIKAMEAEMGGPVIGNCPWCDEPLGDGLPGCVHWPAPPPASPRQGEPQAALASDPASPSEPAIPLRQGAASPRQGEAVDVERLVPAIAYALARAALPNSIETSRDYAKRLAHLVIESGYLAAALSEPAEAGEPG